MRLSNIPLRKIGVVWVAHKLLRKTWRQYFLFDRQTSPRQAAVELFRVLRTRHPVTAVKDMKARKIERDRTPGARGPKIHADFYLTVRQKNGAAPDRVAALVFRR